MDCKVFLESFQTESLQITNAFVDRAHFIFNRKIQNSEDCHAGIIALIPNTEDRLQIIKKARQLKVPDFYVTEDMTRKVREQRKYLEPIRKKAYEDGKKVYFKQGALFIDGRKYKEGTPKDQSANIRPPSSGMESGSNVDDAMASQ